MPLLENVDHSTRSTTLLIGRSGSGKTAAGLSYPKPMKVIDTDGRIRGGIVPWNDIKGVDYTYIPSKNPKGTVFEMLNNELEILQINCSKGNGPQTLFLDSLTWEAIDLLLDAIKLTHGTNKAGQDAGRSLGPMDMSGPEDYKFQSTGIIQTLAHLKTLPIPHILASAHIIPRWIPDPKNKYGDKIESGERIDVTDKLAEKIPSMFDNVYRFDRDGQQVIFQAWFGDLARSVYPIPAGNHDVSGKNFYQYIQQWIPKKETAS
jgi:hypothetical protein